MFSRVFGISATIHININANWYIICIGKSFPTMVQGERVNSDGEFWQRSGQIEAFDFLLGGFESVLVTLVLILFYLADTHK